jgi:hypothetical protein
MEQLLLNKFKALASEYWKIVNKKPNYINQKINNHQKIRSLQVDMYGDFSVLFESEFLNEITLDYIEQLYIKYTDYMAQICPQTTYLVKKDIIYNLYVFAEAAKELELYETVQNIYTILNKIDPQI